MKIAFAAITVCALAACSQTPSGGTSLASAAAQVAGAPPSEAEAPASGASAPLPATTATSPAADAATTLAQYHWQLANATDKSGRRIDALFVRSGPPVQLDFDAQGFAIGNTCNRMRGSYSVAGGKLTLGNLASTWMACNDPALTALDAAAGKYLQGTFTLDLDVRGEQPRLLLTGAQGDKLTFIGEPANTAVKSGGGESSPL
ncbi:MAG TPA: META domain-containing protein [Rhodanobacteraceae bacterium]|jgi:heat shock protein HslJ|nr:META domain-containing protein [Rhodanobacteraceae bacterium]